MKTLAFIMLLAIGPLTQAVNKPTAGSQKARPVVVLETNFGEIHVELRPDKAPVTVSNFLGYVKNGTYNGTIFHRVINNFMIQGGGFSEKFEARKTKKPIKNEAHNGLRNDLGTIAMARTSDIDSATSQFFINVSDNDFLNFKNKSPRGYGYAVFGRVTKGMSVVNQIKSVKTSPKGGHQNVPNAPIVIKSARLL